MTTSADRMFEDRLQVALQDLADEVSPAPVSRWLAPPTRPDRVVRLSPVLAAVAALVVAVVLVASIELLRPDRSTIREPADQPPRVVRLSGTTSQAPGRAVLAFTLSEDGSAVQPIFVVPARSDTAVELTPAGIRRATYAQPQLTADGDHVLLPYDPDQELDVAHATARFAVVDLRSGRSRELGGPTGYCPELDPDAGSVAYLSGPDVLLLDVRTGSATPIQSGRTAADAPTNCSGGLGWSPDGQMLAIGNPNHTDSGMDAATHVVDRSGTPVADLPGHLANRSMSWSPDGLELLLYTPESGRYAIGSLDGAAPTELPAPVDAVTAVGWAGTRIVWLIGAPGSQQLVTTDRHGADTRAWVRLDVGDRPIVNLAWSRRLTGTARR